MFLTRSTAGAALLLTVWSSPALTQQSISLPDAQRHALGSHPRIRAAEAEVARARGLLATARTLAPNPTGSLTIGPASTADTTLTSYQVGLSQTIELGGKRRWRSRGAQERVRAAEALLTQERRTVGWEVERAFRLAQVARERVEAARDADSAGQRLLVAARERLALGAGTQLDLNVAAAAAARDRRARLGTEQGYRAARAAFATALGAGPTDSLVPADAGLPMLPVATVTEDQLVAMALDGRPDLQALAAGVEALEADVRLAGALGWPDPEVGVSAGKAEDFRVTLFSIALPLPLWSRNGGGRAAAGAERDRGRIALAAARQAAEREVRLAYQAYQSGLEAERAFDRDAVARLSENLALAQESFRAGKINLIAYSQVRRELVDARLAHLDALAELVSAWHALQLAAGQSLGGEE